MVRIVHLSDIHLNDRTLYDAEIFVIRALIEDLVRWNNQKAIDLIAISGDLIDKGGESFQRDPWLALLTFEEKVISPIAKAINLPKDRFFFCPGNHDIDRAADKDYEDLGLIKKLDSIEKVNAQIDKNETDGLKRILEFKNFEKTYYQSCKNPTAAIEVTNYQSTFKFKVDDYHIGVTCFNSAWRCYDSETDKGKILVGERQVTSARELIKDCDLRIALMHHPLDWLSAFDHKCVDNLIRKDYNVLLCGHVHKGSCFVRSELQNSLFVSIAPINWSYDFRKPENGYANGYFIIDIEPEENRIVQHNRRYSYPKEKFVANTDFGDETGTSVFIIPTEKELNKRYLEAKLGEKIKEKYFDEINQDLISFNTDTCAPKELSGLFVAPRIINKTEYKEEGTEEQYLTIEEICVSDENRLVFGSKESGKTILLDKLLIEFTNRIKLFSRVPILIDFQELNAKKVEGVIGDYLGLSNKETFTLLENHKVVLLIDDISFEKTYDLALKRILESLDRYPNLRVIGTSTQIMEDEVPLGLVDAYPAFTSFVFSSIKPFKTKQIKELITKWFANHNGAQAIDHEEKSEKVLRVLLTLNLPRTPLAISMFLWIIEQQENYKPVNQATMLENFIERLFKKTSKKEIYSSEFDYRNKERLLTEIAVEMFDKKQVNYRVSYFDLLKYIDDYLRNRKFDYKAEHLLGNFITKGIFCIETEGLERFVRFRFSCFFQYFLMKKMDFDSNFKDYVLDEENFLKFINEIDYYTGIKRDQTGILKMLIDRMEIAFKDHIEHINKFPKSFDSLFLTDDAIIAEIDDVFIKKINANKPDEKQIEKIRDKSLDDIKSEKGIANKDEVIDDLDKLGRLWTLAAKVLKNTEETSEECFKDQTYKSILRCSMAFANYYKFLVENYLSDSNVTIDEKVREKLSITSRFVPLLHELLLFTLMGTSKLKLVIKDKICEDMQREDITDLERYISVFLYADIKGQGYLEYIRQFTKKIKHHYIGDMTLFKLVSYYYFRSKSKEADQQYLSLIAELRVNMNGYKRHEMGKLMDRYKIAKRRELRKEERQAK